MLRTPPAECRWCQGSPPGSGFDEAVCLFNIQFARRFQTYANAQFTGDLDDTRRVLDLCPIAFRNFIDFNFTDPLNDFLRDAYSQVFPRKFPRSFQKALLCCLFLLYKECKHISLCVNLGQNNLNIRVWGTPNFVWQNR